MMNEYFSCKKRLGAGKRVLKNQSAVVLQGSYSRKIEISTRKASRFSTRICFDTLFHFHCRIMRTRRCCHF